MLTKFSGEPEDHIFAANRLSVGTLQSKSSERNKLLKELYFNLFQVKEKSLRSVDCFASVFTVCVLDTVVLDTGARASRAQLGVNITVITASTQSAGASRRGRGRQRPSD